MHCPYCGAYDTKVIDSRLVAEGDSVRRRRECQTCGERFTTFETAELLMPKIVKSDGSREPFNEDKMRRGLLRALEKRPVPDEAIEGVVSRIMHVLRSTGERELPSRRVGEEVMNELRNSMRWPTSALPPYIGLSRISASFRRKSGSSKQTFDDYGDGSRVPA